MAALFSSCCFVNVFSIEPSLTVGLLPRLLTVLTAHCSLPSHHSRSCFSFSLFSLTPKCLGPIRPACVNCQLIF